MTSTSKLAAIDEAMKSTAAARITEIRSKLAELAKFERRLRLSRRRFSARALAAWRAVEVKP
jgi:hypothetical protein